MYNLPYMSAKTQISDIWKDAPFKSSIYTSLVLNLVAIASVLIFKGFLPPVVPLFYGKAIGEGQLVPVLGLLIAPATSIIITILNLVTSSLTHDMFLKKIYAASALLISLLTTISVIKIIFLVGFF